MDINEFILPAVSICSYCICYVFGGMFPNNKRFTPLVAAFTGIVAAIAVVMPTDVQSAANTIISGMVSGLAATGIWEGYKNIVKKGGNQ